MGFVLGLLGGGGSILAVPILVFLVGLTEKAAIATSLLVVGATSAMAASSHARAKNVAWRTGLIFGVFAMGGAYGGGRLAAYVPGPVLLTGFATIMLVAAVLMLRGRPPVADAAEEGEEKPVHVPFGKLIAMGLGVGALTGLVGAGGGFVIVPALVVLGGLSMRRAIGTSLAVIALNSFAGVAGYLGHQSIDLELAAGFVAASIVGTLLGTATSRRVEAGGLRTGFAFFVLIAGTLIFGDQLGWPLVANLAVAGGLTLVALVIHLRRT
jgi:uncharacterized membrane protein YfcA